MRRIAGLVLCFLAACRAGPELRSVEATGDRLSLAFAGDHLADAKRDAALYCANLGRSAVLRDVSDSAGVTIAAFDCR
jgi:hypothetical protein